MFFVGGGGGGGGFSTQHWEKANTHNVYGYHRDIFHRARENEVG